MLWRRRASADAHAATVEERGRGGGAPMNWCVESGFSSKRHVVIPKIDYIVHSWRMF
jgi:hypothetical protein